ncbi:glutathione peroxidase [Thermoflavimicrobium dichotomicum]|uniref:Glutathione peroxidase n=1 Tax=Thermoflavimicrobium dichotomicum TaxID=46223 RepID=A0A1I3RJ97_9BACL|nr:glutathione peroxidase [Thermoflavimicrobium dichotomicum]SFJ45236.1 glutathione peroxidase [Thermoflavimicrobium dichotomicum]
MSIYSFRAKTMTGEEKSLSDYQGKVVLIVNTASKCGFTPQYKELQELYQKYQDQGFVVLAFPSDQFMNQEFADDQEIQQFCQVNFGITFPLFSKVKVKGKDAHPLFQYLTQQAPGVLTKSIKWNFTKFLINKEGQVVKRYSPATKPTEIEKDIVALLES